MMEKYIFNNLFPLTNLLKYFALLIKILFLWNLSILHNLRKIRLLSFPLTRSRPTHGAARIKVALLAK